MSIEQRLEDLTAAINKLPEALAAVLEQAANPAMSASTHGFVGTRSGESGSTEVVETPKATTEQPKEEATSEQTIAGRKTLVWNKDTKTGQVIEKGQVVPTGASLTNVAKAKWDQLCEKYNLDPATGEKALEPEAADELDDDLDLDLGDDTGADDGDDLDLGLDDDEPEVTLELKDVKAQLVKVMKATSREDVLKLLKKHGAKNADDIQPEKFQVIYDAATKILGE